MLKGQEEGAQFKKCRTPSTGFRFGCPFQVDVQAAMATAEPELAARREGGTLKLLGARLVDTTSAMPEEEASFEARVGLGG